MGEPTIDLLRDLIAIDSVNPSLVSGGAGERVIADFVSEKMRAAGLDVQLTEVSPGRPNVVGVLEGARSGPTMMYCGHLDTVGVEGMKSPFDPIEREGKLYGRGSGDMKGGVAAMMVAAAELARSGGLKSGKLVIAAVADEEFASIGAEKLVHDWKADAAVVTEPTDLVVATAHKGFSWVEVASEGRAAHGSRPNEGRDAILAMGKVLSRLEKLNQRLRSGRSHPQLGTGSLHASLISGGRELSTYPDHCKLHFERRTITGEPPGIALEEINQILSELSAEDAEFKATARLEFERLPYETPGNHPLPALVEAALTKTGRRPSRGGMTYWTDAAVLGEAGIPCVIFGPGGFGYHGLEEYVVISEVIACKEALVTLAADFCS